MNKKFSFVFIAICAIALPSLAQNDHAKFLEGRLNDYLFNNIQHKAYVQTNSNRYVPGDTLWFKASLVDAITHRPAAGEKMIYIDLISPDKKVLIHQVFTLFGGFAAGCLPIRSDFPFGTYTISAYTNYMRNFSVDFFFQKTIELLKPGDLSIDWEFYPMVRTMNGGDSVSVKMIARSGRGKDVHAEADVTVQLAKGTILGGKTRLIDNAGTFSFFVPDSLKIPQATLTLNLPYEKNRTERYKIELTPPQPDLQFLPEGGWLLPGVQNRVAFKCVDATGNAVDISGKVYDRDQGLVATFQTQHQGMGVFNLFPGDSSHYEAEIEWKGKTFRYTLPEVNHKGYTLQLIEDKGDSLHFLISKPTGQPESIGLLCHTRGKVHYLAAGNTDQKQTPISVSKNKFPSGITVFTLIARRYPISERLVYIEHNDQLQLLVNTNKTNFGSREKVQVDLKAMRRDGSPVVGSFSLNAYDRSSGLSIDPHENIVNYLLCSSDLNGKTFDAQQFFDKSDPDYARNLDLLMLTSGWRRFNWPDVLLNLSKEKEYVMEQKMTLTGEVKRGLSKKPVPKNFEVTVSLKKKAGMFIDKTKTDQNGKFSFVLPEFTDSAQLVIQTKNRLGKQNDYLIDLQSNLERKSLNPYSFNRIENIALTPLIATGSGFQSAQTAQPWSKDVRLPRKDNYYFPGRDTFMIEEVEIRSDFLTKRDSLIHQTGDPDVVIETAQLQKLTERTPWYNSIWDLIQDQIPGLSIMKMPYDQKKAERYNLVIGSGEDAVYFRVARNTQGRLLIIVDGQILNNRTVKLYDFITYMDPSEIESINFISRPKKYENTTFEEGMEIYSYSLTFNSGTSSAAVSTEINELPAEFDTEGMSSLFTGDGASEIQANIDYLQSMERMMAPPSYLLITTKSKEGIFANRPKGIAHLYLQGLTDYKVFYSPRYEKPKTVQSAIPDQRATLHWDPNIVTDEDGKATVTFYTSDSKSPFDILVQGISVDGLTGTAYLQLNQQEIAQPANVEASTAKTKATEKAEDYTNLKLLAGKVVDAESGVPLAASNLFQLEPLYNVSCNNEGEYFIELQQINPNLPITVNCPGYQQQLIHTDKLSSGETIIKMVKAPTLSMTTGTNARNIVREAIRKSGKMYENTKVFRGYFREAISVNNDYYGIYESSFSFTNRGTSGTVNTLLYETERFKNMEDKNGHRLLILKPNHRNRFYPLGSDVLSMPPSFWQYAKTNLFDYLLVGEVMIGNARCYKIIFDQTDEVIQPFEKGILYIEKESHALRHAQWEISPKAKHYMSYTRLLQSNPMGYDLKLATSAFEASYIRVGDKLVLQSTKEKVGMLVNNSDLLSFERSLVVNGESMKTKRMISNSTFDTLIDEEKAKRMQVKDARYLIEPWVRHGIIKPESYLMNDARYMHDITTYR